MIAKKKIEQKEEPKMTNITENVYNKQTFLNEFEESIKEMQLLKDRKRNSRSSASSWRDMLSEEE